MERVILLLEQSVSGSSLNGDRKEDEKMSDVHTISVLVENKFGALARIAGLFSGRGYNIESLTVNQTEKSDISRMTIVTRGDDAISANVKHGFMIGGLHLFKHIAMGGKALFLY